MQWLLLEYSLSAVAPIDLLLTDLLRRYYTSFWDCTLTSTGFHLDRLVF